MRKPWLPTLVLLACVKSAFAQTVRGTVSDAARQPVSGVVVILVDAASREVSRALSNERGDYRVTAPRAGTYRLRTLRIGFRSMLTESFALAADDNVTRPLTVSTIAFMLDTVRSRDRNSCRVVARDSTSTMFAVWEQIRNALAATNLSAAAGTIRATTLTYTQMIDNARGRVGQQSSDIRTAFLRQPWRSLSPEALRKNGYVFTEPGDVRTYNAPGIDVLLSEEFLGDHCLRIDPKSDDRRLGMAFEPTPERGKVAEIRGTLWLDRATTELRRLEYRYVNVSKNEEKASGGEMSFVRMRNGMWAISKWNIRMPTIVIVQTYNNMIAAGTEQKIDSIKVEGGEIVAITTTGMSRSDTLWSRPPVILSGVVTDSVSGKPVPGSIVSLPVAHRVDTTDARGRFAIPDMLPGMYVLEVRTPSLDSVRMVHQVPVVFTDSSSIVSIRAPGAMQIVNAVCPGSNIGTRTQFVGIIVGTVTVSGDTTPRAGVRVIAKWTAFDMHGGVPNVQGTPRHYDTKTDAAGVYRLCDVPALTELTVQAIVDSATQAYKRVRLPDEQRFGRLDFTIDPGPGTAAAVPTTTAVTSFTGIVVDTAGNPLVDAEVELTDAKLTARTATTGRFRIAGVPVGSHAVVVRYAGFEPMDVKLDFTASEPTDLRIVLRRLRDQRPR